MPSRKQKRQDKLAAQTVDDPTGDGSRDLAAQELARFGGPGFLHGLRHAPTGKMVVDHFQWKLPMVQFLKACLHEKARIDGQLRLSDMVNQWMKDHELVQHEELASLQPGPAKQFSLSPCAKLGTCVCGPKRERVPFNVAQTSFPFERSPSWYSEETILGTGPLQRGPGGTGACF